MRTWLDERKICRDEYQKKIKSPARQKPRQEKKEANWIVTEGAS